MERVGFWCWFVGLLVFVVFFLRREEGSSDRVFVVFLMIDLDYVGFWFLGDFRGGMSIFRLFSFFFSRGDGRLRVYMREG